MNSHTVRVCSDSCSSPSSSPELGEDEGPAMKSSVSSDRVLVEDAARILMKLSCDSWTRPALLIHGKKQRLSRRRPSKRYQCRTCRKIFQSYQALGGHSANHRRRHVSLKAKVGEESKQE